MASNHCILKCTDRNGIEMLSVEILVPYDEAEDCIKLAMKLRNKHQAILYQKFPHVDHYVFAHWHSMDTKTRTAKGMIDG